MRGCTAEGSWTGDEQEGGVVRSTEDKDSGVWEAKLIYKRAQGFSGARLWRGSNVRRCISRLM